MKCARCHRDVEKPVLLAGVPFGKKCAAAVCAAVLEPLRVEVGPEHPPIFLPLFDQQDLLGDRVE